MLLLSHGFLSLLSTQDHLLGWHPPHLWLDSRISIKKIKKLHRLAHRPVWWRHFSVEVPSFRMTLASSQDDKNKLAHLLFGYLEKSQIHNHFLTSLFPCCSVVGVVSLFIFYELNLFFFLNLTFLKMNELLQINFSITFRFKE